MQLVERDAASGSGDDHRGAHFVDVHPRLHRQDADVEDVSVPLFQLAGAGQQVAQVPLEMGAVRRRHQGGHLRRGAGEGARVQSQTRGALAGGGEVHVGEGAVRGDRVGVPHHAAGEVGVQVEGEHDPAKVPEVAVHLLEEVSLGIVLPFGGRGPVQVEDEDVERQPRRRPGRAGCRRSRESRRRSGGLRESRRER